MEKYKKLSDFDIEDIKNKINYKSISKEEKIEKLKRRLHLTNRQASWLIDTKEREDLVDKLMEIENDEDEYAKSKIPFLLHYFDFKVLMIIGVIMIFFSILTLFIPGDSPKYNDSAVMLLGIIFGIGLVFYSLTKFSFLINLKKRYEESNLVEIKKKILDLSIITDGTDTNNRYGTKVIGIKFLVEIDNDEVYLIYPTDHYRKYLKGVRGSFNLENELKKNINKNKEHKILYYDKAKIIKKFDFNINNFIKDYLERR